VVTNVSEEHIAPIFKVEVPNHPQDYMASQHRSQSESHFIHNCEYRIVDCKKKCLWTRILYDNFFVEFGLFLVFPDYPEIRLVRQINI
jgi:hypothetical protein